MEAAEICKRVLELLEIDRQLSSMQEQQAELNRQRSDLATAHSEKEDALAAMLLPDGMGRRTFLVGRYVVRVSRLSAVARIDSIEPCEDLT